jgi:hypothetical protein
MFCNQCQEIVNLDIFFSALIKVEPDMVESLPRPHHKSFADLQKSAEAGCPICMLVCESPRYRPSGGASAERQINFRLNRRAILIFDFDRTNDIDPESLYPINWSMGFSAIRLSAIEGL